ncbi:hypothetical protein CRG98_031412 [Punica granatum]|uniref:Uncharacterized protein n=1 Tax=Punica granatum TaxID=22663 RepID=A0A2I0IVX5_PUNGR|nr:hypothetical protein CRG98_031412 [Punica granatum]
MPLPLQPLLRSFNRSGALYRCSTSPPPIQRSTTWPWAFTIHLATSLVVAMTTGWALYRLPYHPRPPISNIVTPLIPHRTCLWVHLRFYLYLPPPNCFIKCLLQLSALHTTIPSNFAPTSDLTLFSKLIVCEALIILADDIIPNKTYRTINGIQKKCDTSGKRKAWGREKRYDHSGDDAICKPLEGLAQRLRPGSCEVP